MARRDIRPYRDWTRHHPLARSIAAELEPIYLQQMRTGALERAIRTTYGVGRATAMHAIRIARENATSRTES